MSLSRKDERITNREVKKIITITATKQDFRALAQVLKDGETMFNVDLNKNNKDLPTRITISDSIEPDPTMYPKVAHMLKRLSSALTSPEATQVFDNEDKSELDLYLSSGEFPAMYTRDEINNHGRQGGFLPASVMQNISFGSAADTGRIGKTGIQFSDFVSPLEGIIEELKYPTGNETHIFSNVMKPEWVYVQTVDVNPAASISRQPKDRHKTMKDLKEMEDERKRQHDPIPYPADFGIGSRGEKIDWKASANKNQGYVAMLRCNEEVALGTKVKIGQSSWNNFLRHNVQNTGITISAKYAKTPETFGQLLEVFFAYNVARLLKLKDAEVVPMSEGRSPFIVTTMYGKGPGGDHEEVGKISPLTKKVMDNERVIYAGLVVGTGDYLPGIPRMTAARIHDVSRLDLANIPGLH